MDVSMIRRPQDWPFPIPQITAESIDELIDALVTANQAQKLQSGNQED